MKAKRANDREKGRRGRRLRSLPAFQVVPVRLSSGKAKVRWERAGEAARWERAKFEDFKKSRKLDVDN